MIVFPFLGSWIVIGGVEVLRLLIVRSTAPFIYVVSSEQAVLWWVSLIVVLWLFGRARKPSFIDLLHEPAYDLYGGSAVGFLAVPGILTQAD